MFQPKREKRIETNLTEIPFRLIDISDLFIYFSLSVATSCEIDISYLILLFLMNDILVLHNHNVMRIERNRATRASR